MYDHAQSVTVSFLPFPTYHSIVREPTRNKVSTNDHQKCLLWGWEAGEAWSWEEWCKGREHKTMGLQEQERYKVTKERTVLLTYFSLLNFWAYSGGQFRVTFALLFQLLRVLLQIPAPVFPSWSHFT